MSRNALVVVAAAAALAACDAAPVSGKAAPRVVDARAVFGSTPRTALHAVARYTDAAGTMHDLELWRGDDGRLRRSTDGAIELASVPDDEGASFTLVDREHGRAIVVRQENLQRIGVFASVRELATLMTVPAGALGLTEVGPANDGRDCTWYRFELPSARATHVCWSSGIGLALRIDQEAGGQTTTVLEVDRVDALAPTDRSLEVDTTGLAMVHADDDLASGAD